MEFIMYLALLIFGILEVLCLACYSPRLVCWFSSFKPQRRIHNSKQNKIAVLIPARNESAVIENLLDQLDHQTYPRDKFEVFVIVKDPNDKTIEITKKHNYQVHVNPNQTKKGQALDSCLKYILANPSYDFDAFMLVDADTGLSLNFIEEMNNALASGAKLISGCKCVKNYFMKDKKAVTWQGSCNGFIWTMFDKLGNRYRSDHGYNIFPVGTGIMLTADVIEQCGGWPYDKTLTEDCELMYDSAVKGWKNFYYEYAVLYMEEAPTFKETNKRRNRWFTGLTDSERLYYSQLKAVSKTRHQKNNAFLLHSLNVIYLYFTLPIIYFLFSLSFTAFLFAHADPLWNTSFLLTFVPIGVIYLSYLIMAIFVIAVEKKNIPLKWYKKLFLIVSSPLYYFTYYPIIFKAFFNLTSKEWDVVSRVEQTKKVD